MAFELNNLTAKKKFFTKTFVDSDLPILEAAVNAFLIDVFDDPLTYDTAEVRYWGEGPFYGSVSYYQVYQQTEEPLL